jgi:hypothetical protein
LLSKAFFFMSKFNHRSVSSLTRLARSAALAFVAAALSGCMSSAMSTFDGFGGAKTIRGDKGGEVVSYALKVKRIEREGTPIRISGKCQSACTLYLSLPRDQICITPGASFSFHKPYGSSRRVNRSAAKMMVGQYPYWVQDWLAFKGGLRTEMVVMDYHYARYFMRTCGQA